MNPEEPAPTRTTCAEPTSYGPCRYLATACPVHGTREYGVPVTPANQQPMFAFGDGEKNSAIATLLRKIALSGSLTPRDTASLINAARRIDELDDYDDADTLREVELRGRLMHGLPPREDEEWELARSLFDDDAMAEFERWQRQMEQFPPPYDDGLCRFCPHKQTEPGERDELD